MGPKDVGPSKSVQGDPLFLEMESEDGVEGEAETAKLEATMVGSAELAGAIQVQTATMQDQLTMHVSRMIFCFILAISG